MCLSKPSPPKIIQVPAPSRSSGGSGSGSGSSSVASQIPPPPPPPEPTPEAPVLNDEERRKKSDSSIQSAQRSGTRAFRIDLLIPGPGSGLNIPY